MSFQVPQNFKAMDTFVFPGVPLLVVALVSTALGHGVGSLSTVFAAAASAVLAMAAMTVLRIATGFGTNKRPLSIGYYAASGALGGVLSLAACLAIL